ncbi:xanthotoxin 5-hydroxylase CYP82C2-like [Vitis riparia]|uniref:xanthotoxin 5-hydroxylase CYP82C2-like n=1 Tax=Vitis riparia TaxID=96939 RepID=UPI00155A478C|nr:xanthotoxin 5-hydroxylase CYP82C2-like [Vitis riparia]
MGFSLQLQDATVFGILFAIICLWLVNAKGNKNKGRSPPEPSGAWPVMGHLHLLGADKPLHRTFGAIADEYGPIFSVRLGLRTALVVSSSEVAKECYTTKDKALATRPRSLAVKLMGYDHAMFAFERHGPYWRDVRRLAMVELLSNRQHEMLKHVRDSEIKFFIQELYGQWIDNGGSPVLVDMKKKFEHLVANLVMRTVAGKRCGNGESRWCQALGDFMNLMGQFMVSDAVPFLGWLDTVRGYTAKMKGTARQLDQVIGRWVEEHRQKRLSGSINEAEQDFIHAMLSVIDDAQFSAHDHDHDTVIKATCLTVMLAGNDTIAITLTWALSLLMNNPRALKKAQEELDFHVGRNQQVYESDIKKLVYLQAIIKETLRLYPVGPLALPHEAMEDCTIAGFHIRAGTRLLVNLWKLHRDPTIWSDPLEFQPERFLTKHVGLDVRGQHFELLPFGSGRRMCPGISLALEVLQLTLARLLHGFELGVVADSPLDMTEGVGVTIPKATPLEVTLVPRLPSELYH